MWAATAAMSLVSATTVVMGCGADDDTATCDRGFQKADWQSHKTRTGRAIAECDWFDGESVGVVRRALGKPHEPPHRGWYTWEIGDSRASIGPAAWFLLLRMSDGIVVKSRAEIRPV